jgi:predicted Zn-dependent protease
MMMRHRRLPAIAVLVAVVAVGLIYVRSWGRGAGGDGTSLAELEKQIARGKNVPVATWNAYAQKLMEAKRFDDAASAYKKVLEKEPANRSARTGTAIALAKAKNEEEFYKFMSELTYSDPKMAMDLFDRGECQAWLGQARFKTLQHEARAQAMD